METVLASRHHHIRCSPNVLGFTLIELVAGLAIVLILTALLFSAVGALRLSADKSTCANNLRQIHIAFMLHANENDGELPPRVRPRGGDDPANFTWPVLIQPYFDRSLEPQFWANSLPTMYSPAFVRASEEMGNTNHRVHNGYATSYVCNGRIMPDVARNPNSRPVRLATVPEPSRTLLLTNGVPYPAGPTGTILRLSETAPGGIGVDFSYHRGQVNVLMVDGAVLSMPGRPEGLDVYRNGEFLF